MQTYRKYGMISVVGDLEATRSNSLAPGVCTSCKIVFEPSLVTIKACAPNLSGCFPSAPLGLASEHE